MKALENAQNLIGSPDADALWNALQATNQALADAQGKSVETIKALIASLHEFNPMMGHRGCRLAVTYPEIAAMQTSAVISAARRFRVVVLLIRTPPCQIRIPSQLSGFARRLLIPR